MLTITDKYNRKTSFTDDGSKYVYTPAKLHSLIKQVSELVINRLNLQKYKIHVEIKPSIEENDCLGMSHCQYDYLSASIVLYVMEENDVNEFIQTIIHELVHVFLAEYLHPMCDVDSEPNRVALERMTCAVTNLLHEALQNEEQLKQMILEARTQLKTVTSRIKITSTSSEKEEEKEKTPPKPFSQSPAEMHSSNNKRKSR